MGDGRHVFVNGQRRRCAAVLGGVPCGRAPGDSEVHRLPVNDVEAVESVADGLAAKFGGFFAEAAAAKAVEHGRRAAGIDRPARPAVYGVARTMSEAGRLCPACSHPWCRHDPLAGCVAGACVDGVERAGPCGCEATPWDASPT